MAEILKDTRKIHITENSTVIIERTIAEEFDAEEYLRLMNESEGKVEKCKNEIIAIKEEIVKDEKNIKKLNSVKSQVEAIRVKEMEELDKVIKKEKEDAEVPENRKV